MLIASLSRNPSLISLFALAWSPSALSLAGNLTSAKFIPASESDDEERRDDQSQRVEAVAGRPEKTRDYDYAYSQDHG